MTSGYAEHCIEDLNETLTNLRTIADSNNKGLIVSRLEQELYRFNRNINEFNIYLKILNFTERPDSFRPEELSHRDRYIMYSKAKEMLYDCEYRLRMNKLGYDEDSESELKNMISNLKVLTGRFNKNEMEPLAYYSMTPKERRLNELFRNGVVKMSIGGYFGYFGSELTFKNGCIRMKYESLYGECELSELSEEEQDIIRYLVSRFTTKGWKHDPNENFCTDLPTWKISFEPYGMNPKNYGGYGSAPKTFDDLEEFLKFITEGKKKDE